MMKYVALALVVGCAFASTGVPSGASMGGKAKNSYSQLMCSQDPTSWFCISNAQRENLIKLRRQGCTEMECPNTHVFKKNVASLYCKAMRAPKQMGQHMCDPEKDVEVCCDQRAACTEYTCPYGYAENGNYGRALCSGPSCSFVDVNTCCEKPEVSCSKIKFKATPEGSEAEPRPSVTDARSCAAEAMDADDGSASIAGSYLGDTAPAKKGGKPEQCFQLKLEQKANPATTRIPVMPGPPESGRNYGRPSPRPMMRVDGQMKVVDAASRGAEDEQCQGFMCEHGGQFNDAEDNEWEQFMDISWNKETGACYSCIPENAAMGQPSSFHVSRDAETMEPLEGDNVFDCDCPEGYFLNARKVGGACVEFVAAGGECFPNYGLKTSGPYFPCKPDEAMCAHGHCVAIEDVMWDCETGDACDPSNLEECSLVDDCGICGGDGLTCLDCETCYQNFRDYLVDGAKGCQLKDTQEHMEKYDIAYAEKMLGQCKYKMNNPKSVADRDEGTACVIAAEGSCDGDTVTPCNPKDDEPCNCVGGSLADAKAEVAALDEHFADSLEASFDTTGCDRRCWESVKNDCDRPSLCMEAQGALDDCRPIFQNGDGCGLMNASTQAQTETDGKLNELKQKIADTKLEIARKGMAIQEALQQAARDGISCSACSPPKLAAPAGYHANLQPTEEDAKVMVGEQDWSAAYGDYEQSAQSVKDLEDEQWDQQEIMANHKLEMLHALQNLPEQKWSCFGCFGQLFKESCSK